MSRIPPGLLYLTIYNTSLRPASLTSPDDEDAEEQAQILFYTARERAVSRDRMLRQVGLAKALVNFSDMFNSEQACENVHSQTRRMITIETEPDYWIHACIELAKTPRSAPSKRKGKAKEKAKSGESPAQEQIYECHDSSVHDVALRSHIMRGYDDFKLIHGSFTSILTSLGQQALELQLERFFTVWAWRWDIEQHTDFSADLGSSLHPMAPSLVPIVDDFAKVLLDEMSVFVLEPPYVIPPTTLTSRQLPPSLLRHVISRIPPAVVAQPVAPPDPPVEQATRDSAVAPASITSRGLDPSIVAQVTQKSVESAALSSFVTMSSVTRAMDPRQLKWGWPGYLTFGKGTATKAPDVPPSPADPQTSESASTAESGSSETFEIEVRDGHLDVPEQRKSIDVDRESLQEALYTPQHLSPNLSIAGLPAEEEEKPDEESPKADEVEAPNQEVPADRDDAQAISPAFSVMHKSLDVDVAEKSPPVSPAPTLRPSTIHLANSADLLVTRRRRVWQFTSDGLTVVFLSDVEGHEPSELIPRSMKMVDYLREESNRQQTKAASEKSMLPSATNILQPQSAHVLAVNGYTVSSSRPLPKNSEQLYHAKQMFQSDHDVSEVFSRGQNPQHWHVAKRRLEIIDQPDQAQVYMEIARKESNLTDVDNEVAAVVRSFVEQDDGRGLLVEL
ncbi:uncharacterized protein C8Q71DRAFT_746380 [Rhodofomes roseus]|uniref:CCZ1/INTU/HSP4 first Longin domain-containing protein n=1 Tax=Rhodofomes roseus TaxID=34475 RepID=A0ABQ8KR84_9APHY|nr:uncharacterized protein C8Q71DRAFT_746380 [Rhodofomes roseus]KAH9840215.1 hypothetical protein C8Q71DRAFT_746380 [Rhodofomes roseus]